MITTSKKKIHSLIDSFKIEKNSYVIVHSSLFFLGKIEGGINSLLDILISKFGKTGTIIMPTFTFSFRRKMDYNVNKSRCHPLIGMLPEQFRKKRGVYRNLEPLFSFASYGVDKKVIKRNSNNSFGKGSVFDNVFKKKGIILSLGVELSHGITEFLHIEKMANVPFRYDKKISGFTIDYKNKKKKDYVYHFVKNEKFFKKHKSNREKILSKLIEKKICDRKKFGYGAAFKLNMEDLYDYTVKELRKNPYLMIDKI